LLTLLFSLADASPVHTPTFSEQRFLEQMAEVSPPGRNVLLCEPSPSTQSILRSCADRGWLEEVFKADGVHVWRLTPAGCVLALAS